MGNLSNFVKKAAPVAAPMQQPGGMVKRGGSLTTRGEGTIQFTDPSVSANETYLNTKARLNAEQEFKKGQTSDAIEQQVMAEEGKAQNKMERDSRTLNNKMITLSTAFKKMKSQAPSFIPMGTGFGQRVSGKYQEHISGPAGSAPSVKSYDGLLNEVAIAVGKMASPSSRPGPDLINMIRTTLPGIDSTWQEYGDQISFTLQNAEASKQAYMKQKYDPVATQKQINKLLGQVMPAKEFIKFKKETEKNMVVGDPEFLPSLGANESDLDIQIQKLQQELLEDNNQ